MKYNIYISYNSDKDSRDAILGWYCQCKNGLRTLGCCADVARVIFYFSYARKYNLNAKTPAAFLNNLFPHAEPVMVESSDEEYP